MAHWSLYYIPMEIEHTLMYRFVRVQTATEKEIVIIEILYASLSELHIFLSKSKALKPLSQFN